MLEQWQPNIATENTDYVLKCRNKEAANRMLSGSIQDVRVNVKRIHVQPDHDVKRQYKR